MADAKSKVPSEGGGLVQFHSNKSKDPQVIISMGGSQRPINPDHITSELQHINAPDGDNMEHNDAIDIIVYSADKSGVQVKVRDGQNIEAGELFELVMDVAKYPDAAREAFSLWLVSDLLELQLKPNHVPFKLVCYWEELLEKYTTAPEEHQQRDEPVIMFRRNVFYSLAHEETLTDEVLLRLLYHEAKQNILDGKYPLSQADCDFQAAIQTLITIKEDKPDEKSPEQREAIGTPAYYRSQLGEFLPPHLCRRHWILRTKDNPERRLSQQYTVAQRTHKEMSLVDLYKLYLDKCQKQHYYGAAFFRGQAEHPVNNLVSKVLSTKDDPVYVAINTKGVSIIDMDDVVLLLGFCYENLSWQFVESSKADNPNCLPCLFLQFPFDETKRTRLLQIFSREAVLMDNLIEACIELKKAQHIMRPADQCGLITGKGTIAETFSRLSLVTFDEHGRRTDSTVRRPKTVASNANV